MRFFNLEIGFKSEILFFEDEDPINRQPRKWF